MATYRNHVNQTNNQKSIYNANNLRLHAMQHLYKFRYLLNTLIERNSDQSLAKVWLKLLWPRILYSWLAMTKAKPRLPSLSLSLSLRLWINWLAIDKCNLILHILNRNDFNMEMWKLSYIKHRFALAFGFSVQWCH